MEIQYGALIGLYGGLLFGVLGWFFGRRKSAKNRGNDEVQDYVFKTARSISWFATIGTIYIMFTLLGVGVELSVAPALGIIMLVQMSSWGISAAILSYYFSMEKVPNFNLLTGLTIIVVPAILFAVIAILAENWLLLLCPIPLGIIGIYVMKQKTVTEEGGK